MNSLIKLKHFVTFLAAYFVVNNKMTLGALLSVSYIIGQMNSPVNQLIFFFRSLQDAKLSLGRLNEIQDQPDEELKHLKPLITDANIHKRFLPGIKLERVSFQYEGLHRHMCLKILICICQRVRLRQSLVQVALENNIDEALATIL